MNFKQTILVPFLVAVITSIVMSYVLSNNSNVIENPTEVSVASSNIPTSIISSASPSPASTEVAINTSNGSNLNDLIVLGSCIDYEAEGEPLETKLLYGSVVLNRVKCNNSIFKDYDTIEKVCLQNKGDGGFPAYRRLGKKDVNKISKTSKDAASMLLKDGSRLPPNVLYHDTIEKSWAKTYIRVKNESTPGYTYFQYVP